MIRNDWTLPEVEALFELPFFELAWRAQCAHRAHHEPGQIQLCTLSNIKRGGCPEDCAYCPQAARYNTGVRAERLLSTEVVQRQAERARDTGATRFCMGAAWRKVRDGRDFDRVLEMVEIVSEMGLEVCATLGMLNDDQARRLRAAGLTAYNHNIDTSPEHYGEIISTRTFQDRLQTLASVRRAGITVCCGGIIGMGEAMEDRAAMLCALANMAPHPESVPINKLVRAPGTPLADAEEIETLAFLRTIAVARILMPKAMVRLAAGREGLNQEAQVLAFLLGANSIFYGPELLTTPNPPADADRSLMHSLGMTPLPARPLPPAK